MPIDLFSRKECVNVLKWCKINYGNSKYNPSQFKLRFYHTYPKIDMCGEYYWNTNTIYIFKPQHDDTEDIVDTIIHEYTHYKQNFNKYDKLSKNITNPFHHPYEYEAVTIANRDKSRCMQELGF